MATDFIVVFTTKALELAKSSNWTWTFVAKIVGMGVIYVDVERRLQRNVAEIRFKIFCYRRR